MSRVVAGLFCALSLGIAALGADAIRQTVATADTAWLADVLERGGTVDAAVLADYANRSMSIIDQGFCRSDTIRAGITLHLVNLETHDPAVDYESWAAAAENARRFLRYALSCAPADGNAWARLALVERLIAEEPQTVAALAAMSALLSPTEYPALAARIRFWCAATPETAAAAPDALAQDLRTLLLWARSTDAAGLLATAPEHVRAAARAEAAILDADRRSALVRAGLDWLDGARS